MRYSFLAVHGSSCPNAPAITHGPAVGPAHERAGPAAVTARLCLLALVACLTSGCASIGPGTIARDRFDYSGAIGESWQRQLLLNMVKLRYSDTPVFMDVASVINQYALVGQATAGGRLGSSLSGDVLAIEGGARYEDRPTITYNPVMGEKFTRSILTPLPPGSVFSLIQIGFPVDLVFRLSVRAINGLYGAPGSHRESRAADPEYYVLIESLRAIQIAGGMGMRIRREAPDKASAILFFRGPKAIDVEDEIEAVTNLLGLSRQTEEFTLVYGALAQADTEIAILTRSMLEMLSNIAATIEVPAGHVSEHRTRPTYAERTEGGTELEPLLRVFSAESEPEHAFVAVPYRGHWYYVDDRDLASKEMLSFLLFMFSLAESGRTPDVPSVTISAGGG